MNKTIVINLAGDTGRYELDEDAYDRLSRYLDRAAARLRDDPDRAEVLGDLERSIGDKLAALPGSTDRVVTTSDIDAILDEIGSVETSHDPEPAEAGAQPRPRRLKRIREGQQIAGVCNGLAEYSSLDVDWVRTLFVLGTLVTAGILGLVYIALAFILPVVEKQEA